MKELDSLVNYVCLHHVTSLHSELTVCLFGQRFGGALAVLNTVALAANPKVNRVTLYTKECSRVLAEDSAAFLELLCKTPVINRVVRKPGEASPAPRPMSRICVMDWTASADSFVCCQGFKPHA